MVAEAASYTRSNGSSPFGPFVGQYGRDKPFEFTKASLKPEVWEHFIEGEKTTDIEFLKSMSGHKRFPDRPGWYLGVVEDRENGDPK